MRTPSVVRTLFVAMMGTGLAMGVVFPLVVAPFAEYRPGLRLAFAALCVLAGLIVGALNFQLVRRFLLRPVEEVGRQLEAVASGRGAGATRLTLESDDALGRLVAQFNALVGRLHGSLHQVIETVGAFVAHADDAGQTARRLVANVDRKSQVISGTATLFEGLRRELQTIDQVLARLRDSAAQSRTALDAQVRQTGLVTERIAQFGARSEAGAGAMGRAGAALERSGASAEELTRALEGAAASMTQMDATVREIDRNLAEAASLAERASVAAGSGDEAVGRTRAAMERIRDVVGGAAAAIAELDRRVGEIAAITRVIDEVTEQTGLLALKDRKSVV
jgi:methyl-accepting chemotaxis protein